jgi:hypothetical protein
MRKICITLQIHSWEWSAGAVSASSPAGRKPELRSDELNWVVHVVY